MPSLKTREQFIVDAVKIHGDKYDYSKVNYLGNKVKVIIVCKNHGEFMQTPNDHTGKHGCRKCSEENTLNYNLKEAYSEINKDFSLDLYVIEMYSDTEKFLKIGISKQYQRRFFNIKTKSGYLVKPKLILPTTLQEATLLEDLVLSKLRVKYAKKFTKKFPGYKECLNYESVNEIIETIKEEILKTKSPLIGKILDYEYRK
jgi:hypothetical protein